MPSKDRPHGTQQLQSARPRLPTGLIAAQPPVQHPTTPQLEARTPSPKEFPAAEDGGRFGTDFMVLVHIRFAGMFARPGTFALEACPW